MHDPQVPAKGPQGMVEVVSAYQSGADGHWNIQDLFPAGDGVMVRWKGVGKHVGEMNGIPATGRDIDVDAITIHAMRDGKIAESWEVWDTLTFLQQIGAIPQPA